MNVERILIAAECIGDAKWFIDKAGGYARERHVFAADRCEPGGSVSNRESICRDARCRTHGAPGASLYDSGENCAAEANMAKMLAADASWDAANACLQTHGGFGFAPSSTWSANSGKRACTRWLPSRPTSSCPTLPSMFSACPDPIDAGSAGWPACCRPGAGGSGPPLHLAPGGRWRARHQDRAIRGRYGPPL